MRARYSSVIASAHLGHLNALVKVVGLRSVKEETRDRMVLGLKMHDLAQVCIA